MEEGLLTLREAAERCGLQADTLRSLIRHGRLESVKRGRDRFVTLAAVQRYLESRDRRGRYREDVRVDRGGDNAQEVPHG